MFPKKPLTICTIAKASIIKKAKDQFHIFLIPNHIDPNKNAKRLKLQVSQLGHDVSINKVGLSFR